MEPWEHLVQRGILGSLARSSRKAYEAAFQKYLEFYQTTFPPPPLPPTEPSVLRYLAHLHLAGFAPKTIRVQLTGLAFTCKANSWWDPSSSFRVRKAVDGWGRLSPPRIDSRRPISLDMLRQFWTILPGVCDTPAETSLFQAAFALAFYGAFQSSDQWPLKMTSAG